MLVTYGLYIPICETNVKSEKVLPCVVIVDIEELLKCIVEKESYTLSLPVLFFSALN